MNQVLTGGLAGQANPRISATPSRTRGGARMRKHERALNRLRQIEKYRNNINKMFRRAGIPSAL